MIDNFRRTYNEYPRPFWTLVTAMFIDRLGGALLFPFFALYITSKFGVGMTEVGLIFATFSVASFVGAMFGGALTDRMGRKRMLIFSLVTSSLSAVAMALVSSLEWFLVLALVVGLLTETGGPAYQATVADLLPEKQRTEGFGILRVAFNIAVVVGPAIGGFLASRSYLLIFSADAVISLIAATVVFLALPETKPAAAPGTTPESMATTFRGYIRVLRDTTFMLFMGACILTGLVYMNMNATLGVFLRDVHSVAESGYGWILSLNAAMVVLFQFPITRRIQNRPPLLMMAAGSLLYAVGFALYGFVSAYVMFLVAMVVITIGEMLISPVSQALVARFAPEDMRGRYMAVFGFSWTLPFAAGPLLAGLIMDNLDPRYLWYSAGIVGLLAVAGFLSLYRRPEPEVSRERAQAEA